MGGRAETSHQKKVLAVSSGGGHWVQLRRLAPAFEGHIIVYVTVHHAYRAEVPSHRVYVVNDATRWNPLGSVVLASRILRILVRERPDVVISTGAAPGCFAVILGHLLGARTIWLDSIANVDQMSLSGRMVRRYAGLWLSQWPQLARDDGPEFAGTVL